MDEELFNEQQFLQLNQMRQSEFITNLCSGVEKQIRDAQSREEAVRIASAACSRFESKCTSSIVRIAIVQYIQVKVMQYWSKK